MAILIQGDTISYVSLESRAFTMFCIQASNPRMIKSEVLESEDLSEILQSIFPMQTEDALLNWHRIWIPVEYKYDISVMFDDILYMLSELIEKDSGECSILFGSDTFHVAWYLDWLKSDLNIRAKWVNVRGRPAVLDCLNSFPQLRIEKDKFLFEWKMLLVKLIEAIEQSGATFQEMAQFKQLKSINGSISEFGQLYPQM